VRILVLLRAKRLAFLYRNSRRAQGGVVKNAGAFT
jgi:hypothetical protein